MFCKLICLTFSLLMSYGYADWGIEGCHGDPYPTVPTIYTWDNISQATQDKVLTCVKPAEAMWGQYEYNWISVLCVEHNVAIWYKRYNTNKTSFEQLGQWLYYWCKAADLDWTGRRVKNTYIGPIMGPISILGSIFTVIVLYDKEFRNAWCYRYYMLIAVLDCLGVMPAVVSAIFNAVYGYDNTQTNLHRFLQERSWIISDAFWSVSNVLMLALAFDRVCAFYIVKVSGRLTWKYYIVALVYGFADGFLRKFLQAPAKRNVWSDVKSRYEETDNSDYKNQPAYQNLLVYDSIMDMAIAILLCIGAIVVTVGLIRAGVRRKRLNRNCTEAEARDHRLCILLISVTVPVVVAIALEAIYRFLESMLLDDMTTRWHISWIVDHTYADAMRLTLIDMNLLNFDLASHCLNMSARSISFILYFMFHDRIKRKALEKLASCCCPGFQIVPLSSVTNLTTQGTTSSLVPMAKGISNTQSTVNSVKVTPL